MADTQQSYGRIPVHPEDADTYQKWYEEAEDGVDAFNQAKRLAEIRRLSDVAAWKRAFDRAQRPGPVDSERSYQLAVKRAGNSQADTLPFALSHGLAEASKWAYSQPRDRNALLNIMYIPENAILGAAEALSGDKTLAERGHRLLTAIPGAFYPPAGYPIEPARDRMYEALGPIGGTAIDYVMPGPMEATKALRPLLAPFGQAMDLARYGAGARADLVDEAGDAIRRLRNSPRVAPLRIEYVR